MSKSLSRPMLAAFALILCVAAAVAGAGLVKRQRAHERQLAAAQARAAVPAAAPVIAAPPISETQAAAVNAAVMQLNLPWRALQDAVASATPPGVALLALTKQTGVFKPHEIQALDEVLRDYHATNHTLGHVSVTYEEGKEVLGFAYYAPAAMTDRTWYLYWIAVTKHPQARGIGGKLLKHVEDDVRRQRG